MTHASRGIETAAQGSADQPLLLGQSPAMAEVRAQIAAAARTHAKVLVLGETGVGKELVARSIHLQSTRRGRPFIALNCSGIPETLLESELFGHARGSFTDAYRDKPGVIRQADRGTLFLDELGEMSLRMQAALLRFTETGEIQPVGADGPVGRTDVRLITATNRNLRQRIAEGAFREDLYYRLNVIQIHVPPLRERGDDILMLLEHYVARAAFAYRMQVPKVSPDAAQVLVAYHWPGNVRELRNVAERLVLLDRAAITADELPVEIRADLARATAAPSTPVPPPAPPAPLRAETPWNGPASPAADRFWERLLAGEDFWTVVGRAFKAREATRADLAALVDRGLRETQGSYRALVALFNMPPGDYKRFHAFLYQQQCNLPVASYRALRRRPVALRSRSSSDNGAPVAAGL